MPSGCVQEQWVITGAVPGGFADGQVGAVQKALLLLRAFNPADPPVGISELARRVRLAKSTTHRLLKIMLAYGFVRKQDDKYELAQRFAAPPAELAPVSQSALRDCLQPFLADLYALTLGTVHLGVPVGAEVLCLDLVHGQRSPRCGVRPGDRVAAASLAIGLVLLAFSPSPAPDPLAEQLREIRAAGICVRPMGGRAGLLSVAVPLCQAGGVPVAAISVTAPAARMHNATVLAGIRAIGHQARLALGPALLPRQVARR
ncbi:IclR family transcriptional regulator [Crossiella cryophila]|uniref:IclR family transcriptional regulator n=1 Tax=Crossiella cryophila TaxID=43355 RepID=UPI0031E87651